MPADFLAAASLYGGRTAADDTAMRKGKAVIDRRCMMGGRGVRRGKAGTQLKNDQVRGAYLSVCWEGCAPDVGGHEVINPRTFRVGGESLMRIEKLCG